MSNRGVSPLDPMTDIGRLRALLRDTSVQPLVPYEAGYGDYAVYSDLALAGYLVEASGSVLRAASLAVKALAIEYSALGRSVRTEDLAIDVKSRGKDLLEVAISFAKDADAEDARAVFDIFDIVATGRRARPIVRPEATPEPLTEPEGDSFLFYSVGQ